MKEITLCEWEITGGHIEHLKRCGFEIEIFEKPYRDKFSNLISGKATFNRDK